MLYVALFLLWPFLEIKLLIRLSEAFGAGPVFFAWLCSALLGAAIIQNQGLKTLTVLRRGLVAGQVSGSEIFDGFCDVFAGVLLILPGFVSDFAAGLLLIPQSRAAIRRYWGPFAAGRAGHAAHSGPDPDYIIDGEFTRVDDHAKPVSPPDKNPDHKQDKK